MGRRRNSDGEEDSSQGSGKSETISISSGLDSPPNKKLKYKRSHRYPKPPPESDLSAPDENEYYVEKKKHKHKHKKHKREIHKHRSEHYEETESNRHHRRKHSHRSSTHEIKSKRHKHSSDGESRNRHSSRRKRERHQEVQDNYSRDTRKEIEEQQSSRWENSEDNDSNLLRPIKTEPVSSSEEEEEEEEEEEDVKPRVNNNNNNGRNHDERGERRHRNDEWAENGVSVKTEPEENTGEEPVEKETVNMGLSGKLAEDTNTYNGVVIKYSQPPEARKPKRRWRWYIFKGEEELPFLPLHRQSAYLIGRERKVADIPTDHPSCSKQHAVFQYRLVTYNREDGSTGRTVKPYILDLESANGTYVNNRRIDARRYVELLEKDVVKFGYSSREYVLLHEASKGSEDDGEGGREELQLSPVSLLRNH